MNNFTNLCKKAVLMLSLVLGGYASQAQTQIFLEKMGTVTATTAVAAHETANGFDNDNLTMTVDGAVSANASDVRKASSRLTDGTDDANIYFTANNSVDRYFAIEGIDASGFTNLTLDFFYRKETASVLPVLELAYWNGTAYVNVPYTFAEANTAAVGWYSVTGIQLPAAAQINGLKLRWKRTAASDAVRLDEVKLMGTAATVAPTIASTINARANVKTTVVENFSVATTTGTSANQMVKVKMALATPAQASDITLLYEATPGNFLPLTFNAAGETEFGPATGFPLANTATNFKITFAAAGTYNYTLAINDAATGVALAAPTAESVTVAAFVNPTIASTLNGRAGVVTGVQETYDVTTVAGDMAGRMVKVKATLATPAQAANMTLEYFETANSTWMPLTFDVNGVLLFGPPATGFPLANATSNFRVTYNAASTYATTLEIVDATTGVAVVPGVAESVTVAAFVAPTIASTLNNRANVLTTVEENFSVTNTAGSMANQMVRVKLQLTNAAQAANIALSYEATPGNFLPLTFDASGMAMFGPATGFPLTNATTNFKITFSAAGTYDYSLAIVDATTSVNLAPATSESVTVAAFVAPTIASDLTGRANVKTTVVENFAVTTTTGSAANQMVKVKMALVTPAQAADITLLYEATPGNFLPLTFNAAGEVEFGPATGFPLANTATNFKVTFAAAGVYDYTLAIIDATTGVALATPTAESVTVAAFVNPMIASDLNARANLVTRAQNDFKVGVKAGDMAGRTVNIKLSLANAAQASDLELFYKDAVSGNYLPLTFDANGEVMFGPAAGFALADDTTAFRVIFNAPGTYDYNLTIVEAVSGDTLGAAAESVTILINGVKDAQLARLVNVYPNPATEVLNIELGNILKAEVAVLDLTGKQVAALKNVSGSAKLNVANLNAGTYLLQVKTTEGVATKRFVVVR